MEQASVPQINQSINLDFYKGLSEVANVIMSMKYPENDFKNRWVLQSLVECSL